MDAVKFVKTLRRMCNGECRECEYEKRSGFAPCMFWRYDHPEEAVAIVEQWVSEHPIKTRQSEFLKHYPDARFFSGCLNACPRNIFDNTNIDCNKQPCYECKKTFWLAEVENAETK